MLVLWQILSLSLEHRSCPGPATNEGIVQEGAESQGRISCQSGLHDGLLVEDVRVDQRGYGWGSSPKTTPEAPVPLSAP
jgi:hypothetical protein